MAMTMQDLRTLCDGLRVPSQLVPDGSALLINADGVVIALELIDEGRVFDMNVLNFAKCPGDSPHRNAVAALLCELNSRTRCVRYAWIPAHGAIYLRSEVFLIESKLSEAQFIEYVRGLVAWYHRSNARVQKLVETGTDPGDPVAQQQTAPAEPMNKL